MTLSPAPPGLPPRAARLLDDPPGFHRAEVRPGLCSVMAPFFAENLAP